MDTREAWRQAKFETGGEAEEGGIDGVGISPV